MTDQTINDTDNTLKAGCMKRLVSLLIIMSNTYEINTRDEVIPYTSGRRCTDTRAWRDATELELQQRDEIRKLSEDCEVLLNCLRNIAAVAVDSDIRQLANEGVDYLANAKRIHPHPENDQ